MQNSLKIMLVDDDDGDALLAKHAFSEADPSSVLITKTNGREMLDSLEMMDACELPDLILLDINMPVMDGMTALTRLRASPQLQTIPVVIFSTSDAQSDVADAYRRGASGYVVKPGSYSELVRITGSLSTYWAQTMTRADPRP